MNNPWRSPSPRCRGLSSLGRGTPELFAPGEWQSAYRPGRATRSATLTALCVALAALPMAGCSANTPQSHATAATQDSPSSPPLVNTYWKLLTLRGQPVEVAEDQREPHLVLHIDAQRVAGFGGCNRLTGQYRADGDKLRFSAIAGTRMACPQGMTMEALLIDTLPKVAHWRIVGDRLELLDGAGAVLALLESRYLR